MASEDVNSQTIASSEQTEQPVASTSQQASYKKDANSTKIPTQKNLIAIQLSNLKNIKQQMYSWPQEQKLVKLASYSACQAEKCECMYWRNAQPIIRTPDGEIQPHIMNFSDPCKLCTHPLENHIEHLRVQSDEDINRLLGMAIDVDNIYLSIQEEVDTVTRNACYRLYKLLRNCIRSMTKPVVEFSLGQPPFERPNIANAVKNFADEVSKKMDMEIDEETPGKKLTHKEKKKLKKQQEYERTMEMLTKDGQGHSELESNFTVSQSQTQQRGNRQLDHAVDIKMENFSIAAKGKELFTNASLLIAQGRRYGLVGPNGIPYVLTEEESIGQKTHSKLSLSETSLEEIEQTFIPPNITADMTDNWDCKLDEDWDNFSKEFMHPLMQDLAMEDDPEADPEYNILEDETDLLDKEELRTDRAVEVPRKEQCDLIAKLLELTPMFLIQEQEVSRKKKVLDNTTPPIETSSGKSSDVESQLSMSTNNKDIASTEQQMSLHIQYDSEGMFKIPAIPYVSTEEESIGQRTHSKLSLSETSLEEIEQAFIPPNITADMTDNWDCKLDEDWDNFSKEFMHPLTQDLAMEDYPEADPEYNILENETDLLDKEELRTDRAVEVPRKEQCDLIAELLELTPMFLIQEQEVSRKKKVLDNTTPPIETSSGKSSDVESQLSMSTNNKDIASTEQQMSLHIQYDSEGMFKIPAIPYVSTEEESIGQRTHSKLSLSETSLEEIEQTFIPPNITADMTDNWDCKLDEDWDNFSKEFMHPLTQDLAMEDEPEYNILEDETDLLDKEELRTDRAVEVPRKEQCDLIAKLLELTPMFLIQEQEVSRKKKVYNFCEKFSFLSED